MVTKLYFDSMAPRAQMDYALYTITKVQDNLYGAMADIANSGHSI